MAEHHEPQAESIAELATKDAWPPYRVGNSEHIHALGVIASVFNLLEFNFRTLFNLYLRIPSPIAYTLFAKISNEMRLDLINRSLAYSIHPETTKDNVRYFLAGFRTCAENRNILMHSIAMFSWLDPNADRTRR
jgi:argonaute-like protein implicated in RNA metabolism and viral defense